MTRARQFHGLIPRWTPGTTPGGPRNSTDGGDVVDDDDHLLLFGNKVEEFGYAGAARDLLTQNAVAAAIRAQRMSIRYT